VSTTPEQSEGSTAVPDGALFVAADEPVLVFGSVADAEMWLEAVDVEDGVYPAAFGRSGEPFRLTTDGSTVVIERTGEPNRPDELEALLLRYIGAVGRHPDPSLGLDELVATVWALQRKGQRRIELHVWGCIAVLGALAVGLAYLAFR
jgi:hypothetical protein